MAVDFGEVGRTGLNRFGGIVREEFLKELQGLKGVRAFREMRDNDPLVGAVLFAIEMLIRRSSWRVEPGGKERADTEAAEFLQSCLDDMSVTWADTLTEILSMLTFGWSYHEIVYKRRLGDQRDPTKRSRFDDGKIGWRKLPIRAQETLYEWVFDESGGIQAMKQQAPPDYQLREIPIDKAMLFRTKVEKGNPEGRSVLRNAYRPWYFKKNIEEIEGIGIERDLAGLPVLTPPDNLDIWNPNNATATQYRTQAEDLVRSIRRDEQEGVLKPFGWTLELLSTGGRRQFDTNAIIGRYDQRIAQVVLADVILLGHEKVGSFALADSKTGLFAAGLGAWLDSIAEVFNRHAIPRLFRLNGFAVKKLPELKHGPVETPDLKELGEYIQRLSGSGVPLFPDDNLENYLRQVAKLPLKPEEEGVSKAERDELVEAAQELREALREVQARADGGA